MSSTTSNRSLLGSPDVKRRSSDDDIVDLEQKDEVDLLAKQIADYIRRFDKEFNRYLARFRSGLLQKQVARQLSSLARTGLRSTCHLIAYLVVSNIILYTTFYSLYYLTKNRFRGSEFTSKAVINPPELSNDLVQSEFAIFYNVYVPEEAAAQENSLRIIAEQVGQIGNSYAATLSQPARIYYNTLGAANVVNDTYMSQFCGPTGLYNLECIFLEHYDHGAEEHTLHRVHDYCQAPEHYHGNNGDDAIQSSRLLQLNGNNTRQDARRVMYIHNKGSFHFNSMNERWRRLMTYAVTSEGCLHPPDNTCNLCGLYFAAHRGLFIPGNMWTARCDYVARLLPPMEYRKVSTEVMKDALLLHLQHKFDMDLFNFIEDNYGVDRYADELWSGSHPSIKPCDMAANKAKNFGFGHADPFFEFLLSFWDTFQTRFKTMKWGMEPTLPMTDLPMTLRDDGAHYLFFDQSKRLREFTLLGGNLFKWMKVYGEVPPPTSWIWDWFPDTEIWKKAIEDHGETAVETLLEDHKTGEIEYIDPIYKMGFKRLSWWHRWPLRYAGLLD